MIPCCSSKVVPKIFLKIAYHSHRVINLYKCPICVEQQFTTTKQKVPTLTLKTYSSWDTNLSHCKLSPLGVKPIALTTAGLPLSFNLCRV